MTSPGLDILVLGLSLSSSWGNGHATTYRSLLRGLSRRGHRVVFLERDVPWYAEHRDLPNPDFCGLGYYGSLDELRTRYGAMIGSADAVIVGSFVPDGVEVIDMVAERCLGQLCFYDIDTPVTLAKLARGDEEYLARRQVPLFDFYFSFTGGPTLDRIERQYGARQAEALYCSVDPECYRCTGEAPLWDLGYLGTYSADRQPTLERLLVEPARRMPERRFVVAGAQYPPDIAWPSNVQRITHLPPAEHPSFYSRQRYTLNVTRADMIEAGWSPSVRLFEAAACGTPIVSDYWEGLDALLPVDDALRVARTAEDVVGLLKRDDRREAGRLAGHARARVLLFHTGDARAGELEAHLLSTPSGHNAAALRGTRTGRASSTYEDHAWL